MKKQLSWLLVKVKFEKSSLPFHVKTDKKVTENFTLKCKTRSGPNRPAAAIEGEISRVIYWNMWSKMIETWWQKKIEITWGTSLTED